MATSARLAAIDRFGSIAVAVLELTKDDFEETVLKNPFVIVDFWAPWCGPCRMMAPAYEQAARQLEPGVRVAKVNTEEAQALGGELGIRSIPTLALFGGGQEVARTAGAMDAARIVAWVRQHLRQ